MATQGFAPGVVVHSALDPNGILVNDGAPRSFMVVTLLSGVVGVPGHLLGKITSGGKYKLSTTGASDGSQLAANQAVLMEACDASGGDKNALVCLTGGVDGAKLTLGASWTIAMLKEAVAKHGLHVHSSYAIE